MGVDFELYRVRKQNRYNTYTLDDIFELEYCGRAYIIDTINEIIQSVLKYDSPFILINRDKSDNILSNVDKYNEDYNKAINLITNTNIMEEFNKLSLSNIKQVIEDKTRRTEYIEDNITDNWELHIFKERFNTLMRLVLNGYIYYDLF